MLGEGWTLPIYDPNTSSHRRQRRLGLAVGRTPAGLEGVLTQALRRDSDVAPSARGAITRRGGGRRGRRRWARRGRARPAGGGGEGGLGEGWGEGGKGGAVRGRRGVADEAAGEGGPGGGRRGFGKSKARP